MVEGSRLTFIKQTVWRSGGRGRGKQIAPKALYKCECGNYKEIQMRYVQSGHTRSCGCIATEGIKTRSITHGLSKHPLYYTLNAMKGRCYNVTNRQYPNYGGRGVRICEEWLKDFVSFYNWCIANGWKKGLEIDKDVKGSGLLYSPDTCSIVTSKVNANHKRNTVMVEYEGERKPLMYWADEKQLPSGSLRRRIKYIGYEVDKAFTKPMKVRR